PLGVVRGGTQIAGRQAPGVRRRGVAGWAGRDRVDDRVRRESGAGQFEPTATDSRVCDRRRPLGRARRRCVVEVQRDERLVVGATVGDDRTTRVDLIVIPGVYAVRLVGIVVYQR